MKNLETIFNEYLKKLRACPDFHGFTGEDAEYVFYTGAALLAKELIDEELISSTTKDIIANAMPEL